MFCPQDPDLAKNDIYDFIRWAKQMNVIFGGTRYKNLEKEYILEALEKEKCQIKRGELENRLKILQFSSRLDRKNRWRTFYKAQLQSKIAKFIKTHPKKAARIIAQLKEMK